MPGRKRVTVVIDVNLLIRWLIGGEVRWIHGIFDKRRYRVVVSEMLLAEFRNVLMRPRLRKHLSMDEVERAVHRIRKRSTLVSTEFQVRPICRDPKDDYLLALSKVAKADLLITADEDLLMPGKRGKARIRIPEAFRELGKGRMVEGGGM